MRCDYHIKKFFKIKAYETCAVLSSLCSINTVSKYVLSYIGNVTMEQFKPHDKFEEKAKLRKDCSPYGKV